MAQKHTKMHSLIILRELMSSSISLFSLASFLSCSSLALDTSTSFSDRRIHSFWRECSRRLLKLEALLQKREKEEEGS